jgi:Family of unknown function (DUF6057)
MFTYPQNKGTIGLLMNYEWGSPWPEEVSNLYWQLGLVSESQHWAHEAFEQKGYTPAILKRLGMVYMLKGYNQAAKKYFLNLENVPFYGKTAASLIRLNDNPAEMINDDRLKGILSNMPVEDYISLGDPSLLQLEMLLKRNPHNRMAFEYLMAYYLLDGNLKQIQENLPVFNTLAYSHIPIHIQEALIVLAASSDKFDPSQLRKGIQIFVLKQYVEYRQILNRYAGNKVRAKSDLQTKFGGTFWYYLMFVKPEIQPTEK